MLPVKIREANTLLGKPDDWSSNAKCDALFARRETRGDLPVVLTAWKPSDLEMRILREGGSIILGIVGTDQPPVFIEVSRDD